MSSLAQRKPYSLNLRILSSRVSRRQIGQLANPGDGNNGVLRASKTALLQQGCCVGYNRICHDEPRVHRMRAVRYPSPPRPRRQMLPNDYGKQLAAIAADAVAPTNDGCYYPPARHWQHFMHIIYDDKNDEKDDVVSETATDGAAPATTAMMSLFWPAYQRRLRGRRPAVVPPRVWHNPYPARRPLGLHMGTVQQQRNDDDHEVQRRRKIIRQHRDTVLLRMAAVVDEQPLRRSRPGDTNHMARTARTAPVASMGPRRASCHTTTPTAKMCRFNGVVYYNDSTTGRLKKAAARSSVNKSI